MVISLRSAASLLLTRLIPMLSSLLLCVAAGIASAQDVEVSVDRTELARGETLTFTIRVFEQRQGMQLDLTPLTDTFEVLGTRTSSQIRSINGAVEAWTDYIVTLFPLTEGELEIPSLTVNNSVTEAIPINVVNEGPRSNQNADELFLEIEVNKESVYVQEQLLFTVRLFYTINGIRNPQFTELEMPDTVIQLIGSPNQYERLIDGMRYGVYEKRYVIFPQRSGPLEIPDILFRGEVTDGSSNFVFRNLNTRRVTAFIEGITVDVKERPAAARSNSSWLPVSNLRISESWNRSLDSVQVGDSLVRTLEIVADGLDGALLPPFSPDQIDGMNLYPDPADVERTFVDGSIVGTRREVTSLVPTTAGEIEVPEIVIPWWNVETDQPEVTVVPATRIQVTGLAGDVPSEQLVESAGNLQELLETGPTLDQESIDRQAEAELIEVDAVWLNALIAAAMALVLGSIYWLVLRPYTPQFSAYVQRQRDRVEAHYSPRNNESVAYKKLQRACSGGDMQTLRDALLGWASHYLGRPVSSMDDLIKQPNSTRLAHFALQIQSRLYDQGGHSTPFDAKALQSLVAELRRDKHQQAQERQRTERYALPPLYRQQ
jgi:hypothetical protein